MTTNNESDAIATILVQASKYESAQLFKSWGLASDDGSESLLFLEYFFILFAATDRLSATTLDEDSRNAMMNQVANQVMHLTRKFSILGPTLENRESEFNRMLEDRLKKYALCDSIGGAGSLNLITIGSVQLVGTFLKNNPAWKDQLPHTLQSLTLSIAALMNVPQYKQILKLT